MLLCFTGLLRVREALQLDCGDIILLPDSVVLCLGLTKRGMEQKVVLTSPSVVCWVHAYLQRYPLGRVGTPMFTLSYSSVLRWVKKLSSIFGPDGVMLTTHSFRRSGASELARQGLPLADILLYGRWLRERSAREYIRRGEVAVLRARNLMQPSQHARLLKWCGISRYAWQLYDALYSHSHMQPAISRLNQAKFDLFESHVWGLLV